MDQFDTETPVVEVRLAAIETDLIEIKAAVQRIEVVCDLLVEYAAPLLKGKARVKALALLMGRRT